MIKAFLLSLFCATAQAQTFTSAHIPAEVYGRMAGQSLPADARIDTADLRYLRISHYRPDGSTAVGEMVVHRELAAEVLDIFRELYRQRYPIERMELIDNYGADDERSMTANNTSAFCYRAAAGSTRLSVHACGRAIDINPLYNPYVKGSKVLPAAGRKYVDRNKKFPMKIHQQDAACKAFAKRGWRWGGAWRSLKDYQHFEKP